MMKLMEFAKKPVTRVEYYGPIIIGVIISGVYGVCCKKKIDKILKESEVEPKEKEEDEA